jgi:hypothetical protein
MDGLLQPRDIDQSAKCPNALLLGQECNRRQKEIYITLYKTPGTNFDL